MTNNFKMHLYYTNKTNKCIKCSQEGEMPMGYICESCLPINKGFWGFKKSTNLYLSDVVEYMSKFSIFDFVQGLKVVPRPYYLISNSSQNGSLDGKDCIHDNWGVSLGFSDSIKLDAYFLLKLEIKPSDNILGAYLLSSTFDRDEKRTHGPRTDIWHKRDCKYDKKWGLDELYPDLIFQNEWAAAKRREGELIKEVILAYNKEEHLSYLVRYSGLGYSVQQTFLKMFQFCVFNFEASSTKIYLYNNADAVPKARLEAFDGYGRSISAMSLDFDHVLELFQAGFLDEYWFDISSFLYSQKKLIGRQNEIRGKEILRALASE